MEQNTKKGEGIVTLVRGVMIKREYNQDGEVRETKKFILEGNIKALYGKQGELLDVIVESSKYKIEVPRANVQGISWAK